MTKIKASATSLAARRLGRLGGLAGRGKSKKTTAEKILSGTHRPGRGSTLVARQPFDPATCPGIVEAILEWPLPDDADLDGLHYLVQCPAPGWWSHLWAVHGERITRTWIEDHPGTRPPLWWRHVAPGQRARRALDAPTQPANESLDEFLARTSKPITYLLEAEAAFLKRHQLLLPEETHRLRPEDFMPTVATTVDGLLEAYNIDPDVLAEVEAANGD